MVSGGTYFCGADLEVKGLSAEYAELNWLLKGL